MCGGDGSSTPWARHDRRFRRSSLPMADGRADEIVCAEVRPDLVREAGFLGRRTTSINSGTAVTSPSGRREGLSLYVHEGHGPAHSACRGKTRSRNRRHLVRLCSAHPAVRTKERQSSRVTQACSSGLSPSTRVPEAAAFKRSARHRLRCQVAGDPAADFPPSRV